MNTEGSKHKQERRERERRARATETAEEREVQLARCRERYREHRSERDIESIGVNVSVLARWQSVSQEVRYLIRHSWRAAQ